MPEEEKTESTKGIYCMEWTIYTSRRKVRVSIQTDTEKSNIVVYRYWNSL